MTHQYLPSGRLAAIAAALTLVAGLAAFPAAADDDEKRIVKKVRIECDGADCDEHEHLERAHGFAFSTADGPHRMRFRTHIGGGFLGVLLAELTPELRTHFGVPEDAGVMISRVLEDTPAARAGLRVGDIVTAVDGERVGSGMQLGNSVRKREDGETVLLEVWRDGSALNLTAAVQERERGPLAMDWAFVVECDDDESDCSFARKHLGGPGDWDFDFDCGEGDGPCELKVTCDEAGDCVCTANGEKTDCSELPGFDD